MKKTVIALLISLLMLVSSGTGWAAGAGSGQGGALPPKVPQTTAESGTSTTIYSWTPQAVKWAIDALATSYTDLTSFVAQTAWRVFYSDGSGDVKELALGEDGTYLKSNGAGAAPTWATPAGAGDVAKVGSPSNHQWGVWTGDGTLEGVTVTGSKVVCTDADGEPTACTNLTDIVPIAATALDDTKGNGDTTFIWSADKVFDQLALKADVNASTTGSAGSLKSPATTGVTTITGPAAGSTRAKTVRDADDTILELGGTYTPSGTWVWTTATVTWPTFNQNTSGTAANVSGTPALPNGTTATTQTQADASTKLATTAYVDTGLGGKQASDADLTAVAGLTVTRGDLIIGSADPAWTDLAIGAANTVLITNGTDPSWGTVTSAMITNDTITTSDLAAAQTFAEGDSLDLSGITMSVGVDEGLALPTFADVAPATEKAWVAYDAGNNALMVREAGGWVNVGASAAAPTNAHYIVTGANGNLTDESVLTAGLAIDVTDAGGDGGAVTVDFDPTELTGNRTWAAGGAAAVVWTWDNSGTIDPTLTFGDGLISTNSSFTVATGKNITLGTVQWNSADEIDGTKIKDADYGDINVSAGGAWTLDPTAIAGNRTWAAGADATVAWTWNVSVGTDPSITFGNDSVTVNNAFTVTGHPTFESVTATGATGTGKLVFDTAPVFTTSAETPFLILGSAATAADAGAIRLPNAAYVMAEADAASTDISVIGVDSSEVIQIGASGASGVTITPALTVTGHVTTEGVTSTGATGTGKFVFDTSPVFTTSAEAPYIILGSAATAADAGTIRMPNAGTIQFEADAASTDINALSVDSSEVVQIGASGASGVTITPDTTVTGALTTNGNGTFGNADTDTLTLRSLLVGGNSRAVWIAGSAPTPTYATGTNDLYVADAIEAAGNIYAASFVGGAGTNEQRGAWFTSNTSMTSCYANNGIFILNDVLKVCENGTQKDIVTPADSVTWTGTSHSFAGVTNMILPTATPDANGEVGVNNTNETFLVYVNSALKTFDFSSDSAGYVLKSDGSGTFTLQEDATAGSPTLDSIGDPTADSTIVMNAGEEVNFQYTGDYTTGTQFLIQQLTGNPSGGVLFEVRSADSDSTLARFGDGTNYTQISQAGNVTLAGTAIVTAGGLVLGDSSPDADGEVGYASNHFNWFANSEDAVLTFGSNLATFSSGTSATYAFTPSVALNGGASLGGALAMGANNITSTGSLGATGAGKLTKLWAVDAETTNIPTVSGTAILSSLTAPVFSTSVEAPFLVVGSAATAADAGTIRMPNAGYIMAEADAAGDDISVIGVDSSEVVQIGASGASGVTITPAVTVTGALSANNVNPDTADGATLGTTDLEWSDLYLADGGVIYGQNDQSATLTSSAALWTANNFAVTTQFKLPSTDADPTATAGYLRHDSTVTGLLTGALAWYDGDEIRYVVDLDVLPSDDDYVVAYDADLDKFYMKQDANTGSATAINDIGDAAADGSISVGGYETTITSTLNEAAHSVLTLIDTTADMTADSYLLTLSFNDAADVNQFYLRLISDADGSPATLFSVNGTTALSGALAWDLGGATSFEVPNANDPDVDAEGEVSWDANGDWLRMYDGAAQVAIARKTECHDGTIVAPNDLADGTRDAFRFWQNNSGMTFVVTSWTGQSGTDNTTLNIETTDNTGATNATVDAVEIATDGTGLFYATDSTITAGTITNGSIIWLDFDDTDTPTWVSMSICGYYNADVN